MLTNPPARATGIVSKRALVAALALAPLVAAQDRPTPLEALRAKDAETRDALIVFMEDQISSNAVFAGQYSALRELECDVSDLLIAWVGMPPTTIQLPADTFRNGCIHAVRDVIETPTDQLKSMLAHIADDVVEPSGIRNNAMFALAQFGDRTRVDKILAEANANVAKEDPISRARGFMLLADVHYNLRAYGDAADAHLALIGLIESREFALQSGLSTRYYNCACSLALAGRNEEAFEYLEKALEEGKATSQQLSLRLLRTDMDIVKLRDDARFGPLLRQYFGIAADLSDATGDK